MPSINDYPIWKAVIEAEASIDGKPGMLEIVPTPVKLSWWGRLKQRWENRKIVSPLVQELRETSLAFDNQDYIELCNKWKIEIETARNEAKRGNRSYRFEYPFRLTWGPQLGKVFPHPPLKRFIKDLKKEGFKVKIIYTPENYQREWLEIKW